MAVPKRKTSKAKTGSRKSANSKIAPVTLVECPHCKELTQPHKVCGSCGWYDGKQAVEPKKEKDKKEAK